MSKQLGNSISLMRTRGQIKTTSHSMTGTSGVALMLSFRCHIDIFNSFYSLLPVGSVMVNKGHDL